MAQNSSDAWIFSWQLLDLNKSAEIQFFGASCLYNKVSKYFHEIPSEQYDELKNKLLEKLIFYTTNCQTQQQYHNLKLIQRKLNSTLAKLALYLITSEWENCVQDIIQTITNLDVQFKISKNELIIIVLDLLTLMAEEFPNLNLIKPKRTLIRNKLCENYAIIKQFLHEIFLSNGSNVLSNNIQLIEASVKCLSSWIEFGILFNELEIFMQFLFVFIYNEQLFETTCDCLTLMFNLPDNLK